MTSSGVVAARATARRRSPETLAALEQWLAIPSVSADPGHAADVLRAARWLAARIEAAGGLVQVIPTGGPPVVVGRFRPARTGRGRCRQVVVYGHYDVQPAGPGWTTEPFVPRVRAGRLVGRGASDDKGQLLMHVAAVEAWQAVGGPPVEVVVVAEGAEEIGSPGFAEALARVRPVLQPAVVVVSDTQRADQRTPALTVSQRGMLSLDLTVHVGGTPVHPGRLGGAVLDPSQVLADGLGRLQRGLGRLDRCSAAPGRPAVAARVLDDATVRRAAGGRATYPRDLHARVTRTTALTVTRLRAGGASAAVPSVATARLDVRLPPGVPPATALALVRRLLGDGAPAGVRTSIEVRGQSRGLDLTPSASVRRAVEEACLAGFGVRPVALRSGGSIAALAMLEDAFRVTPVLLGLGPPDDRAHGPDESLDLSGWQRGLDTCVVLLSSWRVNSPRTPVARGPLSASDGTDTGSSRRPTGLHPVAAPPGLLAAQPSPSGRWT